MKKLEWYFDFISPFSYLATDQFHRLPAHVAITCIPVLFAGLLEYWKQKGPAELLTKRRFTNRYVQWLAVRHGVPFKAPPAHPFNPLRVLRLSIALDNDLEIIREIFHFIWREGRRPDAPEDWQALKQQLNVPDADERIAAPAVKDALRNNGECALAAGVFGVPTFIVDGELFWGFDGFEFLIDYLNDPELLNREEMRRVTDLPIGVERRRR
ncbi:MAG: 2-hydroxychromene-2-carboxylate isomerase [Acidiferrobacterales bacterium]